MVAQLPYVLGWTKTVEEQRQREIYYLCARVCACVAIVLDAQTVEVYFGIFFVALLLLQQRQLIDGTKNKIW